MEHKNLFQIIKFKAVIFDLDGVITDTASLHQESWKELFNEFLLKQGNQKLFDENDYYKYVDGMPRLIGIKKFLESRNISIPEGNEQDNENSITINGLSKKKNKIFNEKINKEQIFVFENTINFIKELHKFGIKIGVASSSKNTKTILEKTGLNNLFDSKIDGIISEKLNLKGKPNPDIFLKCAEFLQIQPLYIVVVEDSISGIEASVKGNFGFSLGIDRVHQRELLIKAGASLVIKDFSELSIYQLNDFFPCTLHEWTFSYFHFDPEKEKLRETLCTLGNGIFYTRGSAVESHADEIHYPGTYIAGGYNRLISKIYDKEIENEDLVNFPNWLPINFRHEHGEWLNFKNIEFLSYEQHLNMYEGLLLKKYKIKDNKNFITTIICQQVVNMRKPHFGMIKYTIVPENWKGKIYVQSFIDGSIKNEGVLRYKGLNNKHLEILEKGVVPQYPIKDEINSNFIGVYLICRTINSHLEVAIASRTQIFIYNHFQNITPKIIEEKEKIGQEFCFWVEDGNIIEIEKIIALFHSHNRAIASPKIDAFQALNRLKKKRFLNLFSLHIITWISNWTRSDLKITLNNEKETKKLNLILRIHAFHLQQLGCLNILGRDRSIPARGLSGEAYRGHIFWDELFLLPFYNLRFPEVSQTLLLYRYYRLEAARDKAKDLGYFGALFPWQSGSNGREESQIIHFNPISKKWIPDNTHLQYHINITIFFNIWNYFDITNDIFFMENYGAEILFEIARFWGNYVIYNEKTNRYEIHKVMGPDEFHDKYPYSQESGLNNNAYTNVMVAWCLDKALYIFKNILKTKRKKEIQKMLYLENSELKKWEEIISKMTIPINEDGIILQFEGYDKLKEFNWEEYKKKYKNIQRLDRILNSEGDSTNNYKISKQADVCMIFYLLNTNQIIKLFEKMGYTITEEHIIKNIYYYLERTSHGSTLSMIVYSAILHNYNLNKSWELYKSFIQSDIEDTQHGTTPEGFHVAPMAASINLLITHYSGIDTTRKELYFNKPNLPNDIKNISFSIQYQGKWLNIFVNHKKIKITIDKDDIEQIPIIFNNQLHFLPPGYCTHFNYLKKEESKKLIIFQIFH